MTDSQMTESLDQYFAIESAELIQTIEQTLVALLEEKNIERVHTLMRAAHTIKGGAANCGLKTIETIAHHLEDVFQALYPEELVIDDELGALLLEGYEVLYTPLSAILTGYECDEEQILEQTADLFARLQAKLGDFFGREAPLPTAEDLGFDVVGLIFGDSVPEDLNNIRASLATGDKQQITELLKTQAEFFLELGASYSLPGISQIAEATLRAIELNPHMIITIGEAALANFELARTEILAGDRENGGTVSAALTQCLIATEPQAGEEPSVPTPPAIADLTDNSDDANDFLGLLDAGDFNAELPANADASEFLDFLGTNDTDTGTNNSELFDLFDVAAEPADQDNHDLANLFDITVETADNSNDDLLDLFDVAVETADNSNSDLFELFDTAAEASSNNDANDLLELVESEEYESVEIIENSGDLSTSKFVPLVESSGSLIDEPEEFTFTDNQTVASNSLAMVSPTANNQSAALATSAFPGQLPGPFSAIDRILYSISTELPEAIAPQAPPAAATINVNAPTIRVAIERLDRLSHAVSELLIDESQQNNRTENIYQIVKEAIEELGRAHNQLGAIRHWSDKNLLHVDKSRSVSRRQEDHKSEEHKIPEDSTKVAWTEVPSGANQPSFDMLEMDVYSDLHMLIQKLSDHMDLLGERLENLEGSSQRLRNSQNKRQRIFGVAQDELLQARMEPISTVFDRFPRLVQQMVAKHKKPAELILAGTSVLVDKSTAEKLYDPLLHLIRNSYDHGLETPDVRAAQGKNNSGQITISAHHHGNRTTIEVKDNGGGLNFVRIRQKAVEQNLISANQAAVANETELAELLFHPGFSTADKVSELSGRGIGLDVVRTQIEALQGSISVKSVIGQGTTFSLQIPLSFTTARLLICKSQGKTYALLSDSVQQIIIPLPKQLQEKPGGQTLYRYQNGAREELIAVQNLADLVSYNCPVTSERPEVSPGLLIMVQAANGRRCLAIDKIVSEQELVITPVGNVFAMPTFVQGSSTLGDGSLTLAIDPVALLDETGSRPVSMRARDTSAKPQLALAAEETALEAELLPYNAGNNQITVLIVDDSLVQRQGLLRTLSGAGYQVLQAANGQEALAQLNQHHEVQVVVCDIEMPYMNGFEFLSYCRQDARLSQIPTIMLTTRSGAKHRQLALALGAKAYTTKPHADQELLTAVENMLRTPALV
jgi:two-component system, chemotaxis family, sensor histidine kinase and response regulator PixL